MNKVCSYRLKYFPLQTNSRRIIKPRHLDDALDVLDLDLGDLWLRTNGVSTNGVAAKVTMVDSLEKQISDIDTACQILTDWYPTSTSVKRHELCSDPICAVPICSR